MLKFINICAALIAVMAAAFLLGVYVPNQKIETKPEGHIKKLLPENPEGWKTKELPLGSTEEVKRSVEKQLDVSDYLNREYTSPDGKKSFVIYISYWGAGKADPKVASAHTPDRCWVLNGWKSDDNARRSDYVIDFDGGKLQPAYYREMTYENDKQNVHRNVCFWHIVNGKLFDYGKKNTIYASISLNYIKNAFKTAFEGAPEQYFIRVDTSNKLSELENEPAFKSAMKGLGELGLKQSPPDEKQADKKDGK